jgi:hypothetical protein
MTIRTYPKLDGDHFLETRNTVHAYTQVIGDWRAACQPHRKHWWHASVYPSVRGVTTGLIQSDIDFELELDLHEDLLHARVADGESMREPLGGRPGSELAAAVAVFLTEQGIERELVPAARQGGNHDVGAATYSPDRAQDIAGAIRSVSAAMTLFRASIAEETSPVQLWPHHFDLALLYLPGEKIPGEDPANEELSDKQMNFGFAFGDASIPEPYFYVTAYPFPDGLTAAPLPDGAVWQKEGFSGAVLRYRTLLDENDPQDYLVQFWSGLLAEGKRLMLDQGM